MRISFVSYLRETPNHTFGYYGKYIMALVYADVALIGIIHQLDKESMPN